MPRSACLMTHSNNRRFELSYSKVDLVEVDLVEIRESKWI